MLYTKCTSYTRARLVPYAALLVVSAAFAPSPSFADPGEPIVVRQLPFDWIVRHIDQIRLRGKDVRFDLNTDEPREVRGAAEGESVLVLDAARISCIRKYRKKVYAYATMEGENYRIDLKRCAKPLP